MTTSVDVESLWFAGRIALTAIIVLGVLAGLVRVAGADTMVTVLRISGDADDALRTRVEGQTVDLDVDLQVVRTGPVESSLGGQLDAARTLAEEHDARVVVWFRRDGNELIVAVAEPDADRVLVRRIKPDKKGDRTVAASAVAEAAALVVRSALRALAEGGEIGVSEPEAAAAEPQPDVERPTPVPPVVWHDDPLIIHGATWPLRATAALAWTAVMDGGKAAGHHGVGARIGVAGGRYRFALQGATRPRVTYRDELSTFEVGRTDLAMVLAVDLSGAASTSGHPRTRIGAEVSLGATRWARSTTEAIPGLSATEPSSSWSPVATPAIRFGHRFGVGTWIELALGVDLVARPPEYGTATPQGFVSQTQMWPAEPHVALGLALDMF